MCQVAYVRLLPEDHAELSPCLKLWLDEGLWKHETDDENDRSKWSFSIFMGFLEHEQHRIEPVSLPTLVPVNTSVPCVRVRVCVSERAAQSYLLCCESVVNWVNQQVALGKQEPEVKTNSSVHV